MGKPRTSAHENLGSRSSAEARIAAHVTDVLDGIRATVEALLASDLPDRLTTAAKVLNLAQEFQRLTKPARVADHLQDVERDPVNHYALNAIAVDGAAIIGNDGFDGPFANPGRRYVPNNRMPEGVTDLLGMLGPVLAQQADAARSRERRDAAQELESLLRVQALAPPAQAANLQPRIDALLSTLAPDTPSALATALQRV